MELKECLEALVNEQKLAEVDHASNSLYSRVLWMRLVIGYRYFAALAHQQPNPAKLIKTRTNSSIFMKDCKPRFHHIKLSVIKGPFKRWFVLKSLIF